jgi:hypothetical protein
MSGRAAQADRRRGLALAAPGLAAADAEDDRIGNRDRGDL